MTGTDRPEVRRAEIAAGLAAVRQRIDDARLAAGRTDDVDLVVVTKTFPASDVAILQTLGVVDVAENRDQEARAKREACRELLAADPLAATPPPAGTGPLRWHMIGQLQRNKASSVARWADVVESVDRPELVAALGRAALAAGRDLDVLVQVNLDPQPRPDRGGVPPDRVEEVAALVAAEPGLRLRGVMGVAPTPRQDDPRASAAAAFARLAEVAAGVRRQWPTADRISAGMSGDLEEAVAHGTTQVRVGGAVLGARPPLQ